jgi:hypothetical protein
MQLSDYALILRRRWWIILLTAVVAAASGYAFSKIAFRLGALYRTEATYRVVANVLDLGLANVLENKMNSYRDLALAPTSWTRSARSCTSTATPTGCSTNTWPSRPCPTSRR